MRLALRVAARAKLNVGLRVLGRRPDGYHDLDSFFVHLDLADTLTLEPSSEGDALIRLDAGDPMLDARPLPMTGDNLVLRALDVYRTAARDHGVVVPPVHFTLAKAIPWGAGLGGGSADAGAALRALAAAFPAGVDLHALALTLGSDVPFCLSDAPAARVGGRGERLATATPPRERALVLLAPPVAVAPAAAFGWWGEKRPDAPPPDWERPVNALQGPVAARVPLVAAALAALEALPADAVAMSGSGSTCFAFAPDRATAQRWTSTLRVAHPTFWARAAAFGPVNRR